MRDGRLPREYLSSTSDWWESSTKKLAATQIPRRRRRDDVECADTDIGPLMESDMYIPAHARAWTLRLAEALARGGVSAKVPAFAQGSGHLRLLEKRLAREAESASSGLDRRWLVGRASRRGSQTSASFRTMGTTVQLAIRLASVRLRPGHSQARGDAVGAVLSSPDHPEPHGS